MQLSRRSVIAGAAGLLAPAAMAQRSIEYRNHDAFSAWTSPPEKGAVAPLDAMLETADGEISVLHLLDGRPAVLALWATWCGPCLIEKAGEAQMARRLAEAGARTRILLIQAYDEKPLDEAVVLLKRIGATDLPSVRATPAAEKLFLNYFGASTPTSERPFMPSIMLADGDGTELGRAVGMMKAKKLRKDYWYDDATFDFLSKL